MKELDFNKVGFPSDEDELEMNNEYSGLAIPIGNEFDDNYDAQEDFDESNLYD